MKTVTSISMLALMAAVTSQANAAESVTPADERIAADHAPMGVRAGAFLIIPKVDLDETYNDNIYATTNNTKSDFITTVRPGIAAKSNWSRHALNASAQGEFNRYADQDGEDNDNFALAADGRVDIMRDTSIGGGVGFNRDHEDRGNPNSPAAATEPTEYDTTTARIGAYRGLGRLSARVDSQVQKLDYKNSFTNTGGLINNNLRDRNEYTQTLRVGYRLDPRFEAFVRGTMDTRAYDNKGSTGNTNRSNHGQSVVVGSAFDVTGKTKGEVYAGGMKRNYTDSARKDISDPTWGGKVTWNASQLTTVIGSVDRTIEETTLVGSAGYVSTLYNAIVQHALTRDVLLHGDLAYGDNDYKGAVGGQRKDKMWGAGAGADYYFGKHYKAGLNYTYDKRDSNTTGGDYDRNMVLLRLTATY